MLNRYLRRLLGRWDQAAHSRGHFEVSASLRHGESLFVFCEPIEGHSTPLEKGVELFTTPELYPLYYNHDAILIPVGVTIHLKFAVYSGGKFENWILPDKDISIVAENTEMVVRCDLDEDEEDHGVAFEAVRDSSAVESEECRSPVRKPRVVINDTTRPNVRVSVGGSPSSPLRGGNTTPALMHSPQSPGAGSTPRGRRRRHPSPPPGGVRRGSRGRLRSPTTPSDPSASAMSPVEREMESCKGGMDSTASHGEKTRSSQKSLRIENWGSVTSRGDASTFEKELPGGLPGDSLHNFYLDSGLTAEDGVIVVAYRLPVFVSRDAFGRWSVKWDEEHLLCPYEARIKVNQRLKKNSSKKRQPGDVEMGKAKADLTVAAGHAAQVGDLPAEGDRTGSGKSEREESYPNEYHNSEKKDGVDAERAPSAREGENRRSSFDEASEKEPANSFHGVTENLRVLWVGTVRSNVPISREEEEEVTLLLAPYHCKPVFLPAELAQEFEIYCNGTLWRVFHHILDVYGEVPTRWVKRAVQEHAWHTYTTANRKFADTILEAYCEGDLIWIHDLHHLVLPSFLSRRLRGSLIGYFLSTPFPSSELFRTLSVREALLTGLLNCDHIGFHLFEHARHFLTCCRRMLGLSYVPQPGGRLGVEYGGRIVSVTITHPGAQFDIVEQIQSNLDVVSKKRVLEEKYDKKQVVVGIDMLNTISGLPIKLRAIDLFLRRHPELKSKFKLVQVVYREQADGTILLSRSIETKLRQELESLVQTVNEYHGDVVELKFVERTTIRDRLPLLAAADALVLTHIRGDVNLIPFEFVLAQKGKAAPGLMVLSEFIGCCRAIQGGVTVNPWRKEEVVESLEKVFFMPEDQRLARHERALEFVHRNPTRRWAEHMLEDLKRARSARSSVDVMGIGLGLGFRIVGMHSGFRPLDVDQVLQSYRRTKRRVIVLDFGGTLVEEQDDRFSKYLPGRKDSQKLKLSPKMLLALQLLCADKANVVFVVSGKERSTLVKTFVDVPHLGLAAEHGYRYCWGNYRDMADSLRGRTRRRWQTMVSDHFDSSWREIAEGMMKVYTQRTDGTYIEKKGSAVVWHFEDADPEFGHLQAQELQDQLTQALQNFSAELHKGPEYLEVRFEGVNKGLMVERIVTSVGNPDFVLCMGDDASDEPMFHQLDRFSDIQNKFTVTVGRKPSAAQFYVDSVGATTELLSSMGKLTHVSEHRRRPAFQRTWSASAVGSIDNSSRGSGIGSPPANLPRVPVSNIPKSPSSPTRPRSPPTNLDLGPVLMPTMKGPCPPDKSQGSAGGLPHSFSAGAFPVKRVISSQTLDDYFKNLNDEEEDGGIFF